MRRILSSLVTVAIVILVVPSCDDAMSPRPWLRFAGKELRVTWCCTLSGQVTELAIYQDGTVHAFDFGSGFPDTLSHVSRRLNVRERATIIRLIGPFPTFKSHYPGECWPDGGASTFTLLSDGSGRRVFICAGSKGVPPELYELHAELIRLYATLLKEGD